ncbi:hypothetical protein UlMin_013347 [Ulmus minor]
MEGRKQQQGNSSSSLPAELFGVKEPPSQHSTGIFASMFPPPPKVVGRNYESSDPIASWQKEAPGNQAWNTKHGNPAVGGEGTRYGITNNKEKSSAIAEERVEPCHLSSSLYYGGQEVYSQSPSTQTYGSYPLFKKDGKEDDPSGGNSNDASRGNWWQGSLYY